MPQRHSQGCYSRHCECIDGGDHPICWLKGSAGSGKSIAQTVAEIYADRNCLASSFFFLRGAGRRSDISRFITTLAHQLAFSLPSTKPHIKSVLQSDPSIIHRSLDHQFEKLIIGPLLALTEPISTLLFVVDALDECNDKDPIANFIQVITRAFSAQRLPFRFFFTSRVEEHLRLEFEDPETSSLTHSLALEDYPAEGDIRMFLQSRFSTIYKRHRSRLMKDVPSPWPSDEVLGELVKKTSGSFIFASTLVSFVDGGGDLPQVKLQNALSTHTGLDPLYAQVLSDAERGKDFGTVIGTI